MSTRERDASDWDDDWSQDEPEPHTSFELPLLTKAGIIAAPGLPIGLLDLLAHGGPTPLALSAFGLALLASRSSRWVEHAARNERLLLALAEREDLLSWLDRWTNGHFSVQLAILQQEHPEYFSRTEQGEADQSPACENEGTADTSRQMFAAREQAAPQLLERVSIDLICQHLERNSYWLYLGRSLTRPGGPATPVNFYKQHIKIIGTSQRGKSSMAAAIMEIATRTHDPSHVQLALLDQEDLTSRLFAHLPHVASWRGVKLHAWTQEQVIASLGLLVEMMEERYRLPTVERQRLPLVLIYLEEFLDLKNDLKNQIKLLRGEGLKKERDAATSRYAQFALAVNKLALRGLKARMQFLLCAQVDYADEEFKEALSQFGIGLSFCVKPTAALAAGFSASDLLRANAEGDQTGTAVAEAPGLSDHLLVPAYDLEEELIAWERDAAQQWNVRRLDVSRTSGTALGNRLEWQHDRRLDVENDWDAERETGEAAPVRSDVWTSEKTTGTPRADEPDATSDARLRDYRLSEQEIPMFISAYRVCGNRDRALGTINKGTNYRAHAREIIQALDLKQG